jgi:hypothetical protein
LRLRGKGPSTNEQSVPATRHATQLSSSSPMTQSVLRFRQASQGPECPLTTESESGESKPLRSPEYESRCILLWRLGGKRGGLGAIAMGAVLGTAQGVDMTTVKGERFPSLELPNGTRLQPNGKPSGSTLPGRDGDTRRRPGFPIRRASLSSSKCRGCWWVYPHEPALGILRS